MPTSIDIEPEYISLFKLAARLLKNPEKRLFMAEVSETLCSGSARLTESTFGFGRKAVALGINEKKTWMICYGNYEPCGKNKSEVALVGLEDDIRSLVEPESQADSRLRNTFAYTRITAKVVRQKLVEEKNWQEDLLPKERTISNILNRMGYKLRKVQKSKPEKKYQKLTPSSTTSTKLEQKPVNDKTRCRSA